MPVAYGYIGDIHERKAGQSGCSTTTAVAAGWALGPGDSCYVQTAAEYDQAFETFFARLAAAGITPDNTVFVVSAEENDQFDGANVGRAIEPTPAGCDGVNVPCQYDAGQSGEINTNLPGLLAAQNGNMTPFTVEPQGAVVYVNGQPGPTDPATRQLERDIGSLTNPHDPYTGVDDEPIAAYLAGSIEQQILHLVNADPARTPTFTLFPKPDYYFGSTAACTADDQAPCASNAGGTPAERFPRRAPTAPGSTSPTSARRCCGWRPRDSYVDDGRVLSEILTGPNGAIAGSDYRALARCCKQLNAGGR